MPRDPAAPAIFHSAGLLATPGASDLACEQRAFDGVLTSSCITVAGGGRHGGDWCEIFSLADGTIGMSIGDVCGHGEVPFTMMTALRQIVRDTAMRGFLPSHALTVANAHLVGRNFNDFATAIFGILDPRNGTFTYSSAGHPAPLIAGAFGAHYIELGPADLPLGVSPAFEPALHTMIIPAETLVVLYTDGVTEHGRDAIAGADELSNAALATYHFAKAPIASEIANFMGLNVSQEDDAAILTAWISPT